MPQIATSRAHWAFVSLLLAAFVMQSALAWRSKSPAFDEPVHLAAGWSNLRSFDARLSFEHPPFLERWAAMPLLAFDLRPPGFYPGWSPPSRTAFAHFLLLTRDDFASLFFAARCAMLLLGLLMGLTLYCWARELWGAGAALYCLALFAFSPNLIAHAAVIGTDFGAATFGLLGLWTWARVLERPTGRRTVAAAAATALVALTKFSLLPLVVVWLVWSMLAALRNPQPVRLVPRVAIILLAAPLALLVDYGGDLGAIQRAMDDFVRHAREGHHTYLMGEPGYRGWFHYFVVAWLVKTPLPEIMLVLGAVARHRANPRVRRDHCLLTLPFAILLCAYSLSRVCIGYRHILVLVPLGILMAGSLFVRDPQSAIPAALHRTLFAVLLAWQILGCALVFPHPLAFFNEAVGGPRQGWKYLSDSNLDWGQDLPALASWMERNHVSEINLAYFGMVNPRLWGIRYRRLPGYNNLPDPLVEFDPARPAPGIYAISATCLTGQYLADPDTYKVFRSREPIARPGHSILVYRIRAPAGT